MVLKGTSVASKDTSGVRVSDSEISAVRGSLAKGGLALREWMEDHKKNKKRVTNNARWLVM